jgi:hypothetical protein
VRLAAAFLLAAALGCASGLPFGESEPLRLSQLDRTGDPTRRASLRLCVEGLDAEVAGRGRSATSYYERAIQLDPTNPYAYLSLARHAVDAGDGEAALEYLDRAEQLLAAEGALSPGVEAHVAGLRGGALAAEGRDGASDLAHARGLYPGVWGDGRLSAAELR